MADDPDFQKFVQTLSPDSAPTAAEPAAEPASGDEGYQKFVESLDNPSAPEKHAAITPHMPHAGPAAPVVPAGPAPEWSEALSQGAHNLIPSAVGVLKDVGTAVAHPVQTLGAIKDVGSGALSQVEGALGAKQDPKQKAQTEAVLDALEDHYKQIYGPLFSGDTGNLRKAISKDPASVLMDASTFVTGGGSLAAKAAGETGAIGKAASIAAKAAQAVDPVNLALQGAKKIGQGAAAVTRTAQGVFSGVPSSVAKIATQAGAESDPAMRQVFLSYMHGDGSPAEFQQAAQAALTQVKQDASAKYLQSKAGLSTARPKYLPISEAIQDARSKTLSGGYNAGQFSAANDAIDQAEDLVRKWRTSPVPSYNTLQGFDNLKQSIWDLRNSTNNAVAKDQLGLIYNGVKKSITDVDPGYAKLMDQYQEGLKNLNDLTKTFGLGNNAAASTAMAKAFRQMKTEQGQNLFSQLAAKDKRLPYMVAGSALNPWLRGGHGNLLEGMVATGLAVNNPATIPFTFSAQSPRVSGMVNYGIGATGRRLAPAIGPAGRYGAYQLGKMQNGEPAPDHNAVFDQMIRQESGGRQSNADGSPITSPKGAIGAAQVMPGTGPEAAGLAGEPWDESRLRTDPEYNKRLGRAYYEAQAHKFGDPFAGAAAYNAGPTAVERAFALAQSKGGSYLDHLPKETQDYVGRLLNKKYESAGGRIGRASGGTVDDEALINRLMNMAKQAKRATDKTTKPLLNVPDESIVKALDVAQQAI